ncbi:NUDIX domain-containing protein [Brevundimonas denitrificans]|uniref:NUDIX domain-containing protein n=1 Tax=Brevundimonas denitrificans TaxID=1443434 RepID=UPI00352F0968
MRPCSLLTKQPNTRAPEQPHLPPPTTHSAPLGSRDVAPHRAGPGGSPQTNLAPGGAPLDRSERRHSLCLGRRRTDLPADHLPAHGRWIFPKGMVEDDMTPARSAAKEAWEEAGVRGDIGKVGRRDLSDRKGRAPQPSHDRRGPVSPEGR